MSAVCPRKSRSQVAAPPGCRSREAPTGHRKKILRIFCIRRKWFGYARAALFCADQQPASWLPWDRETGSFSCRKRHFSTCAAGPKCIGRAHLSTELRFGRCNLCKQTRRSTAERRVLPRSLQRPANVCPESLAQRQFGAAPTILKRVIQWDASSHPGVCWGRLCRSAGCDSATCVRWVRPSAKHRNPPVAVVSGRHATGTRSVSGYSGRFMYWTTSP